MGRKIVVSGYPIINEKQELLGALSFSRDITELDYLKKTNDQVAKIMLLYEEEIETDKKGEFDFLFYSSWRNEECPSNC